MGSVFLIFDKYTGPVAIVSAAIACQSHSGATSVYSRCVRIAWACVTVFAGESLDEESVAQLVCMYIGLDPEDEGLGLYQRELEDLLLASTKQFYDRKAKEWIATSTFAEYLRFAEV